MPLCVSSQVTPAFSGSYRTVAMKYELVLTTALAVLGKTETEIGSGGAIVLPRPPTGSYLRLRSPLALQRCSQARQPGVYKWLTRHRPCSLAQLIRIRASMATHFESET